LPDADKVQFDDFPPRPLPSILLDDSDPELVDLLEQMVLLSPHRRLTAQQALEHPWFAPRRPVPLAYPGSLESGNANLVDGQNMVDILTESFVTAEQRLSFLSDIR